MDLQGLASTYHLKSDDELLQLAERPTQLTTDAQIALSAELALRGIRVPIANDQLPLGSRIEAASKAEEFQPAIRTGEFIEDVLRFYGQNHASCIKLIFPAVFLSSAAYLLQRHQVLAIERSLPHGVAMLQHGTKIIQIGVLTWGDFVFSWMAFSFSFAALCVWIEETHAGFSASLSESFKVTLRKAGLWARLSLLLFVVFLACIGAALAVAICVIQILPQRLGHPGPAIITLSAYLAYSIGAVFYARFALAIPALILDDCSVPKAISRSYRLTSGKSAILAVLLFKSILGGYIAGKAPFWFAGLVPASIHLHWWFGWILTGVSVFAVALVEPVIFIGFALLYLQTTSTAGTAKTQAVPA